MRPLTKHQATIIAKAMWDKQQSLYPATPWSQTSPRVRAHAVECAHVAIETALERGVVLLLKKEKK
jgi:hypothetical protein